MKSMWKFIAATVLAASAASLAVTANAQTVLKLSHTDQTSGGRHATATFFANKVEELTQGRYKVRVFCCAQLGSDPKGLEQTIAGSIDVLLSGVITYSQFMPAYNVAMMPFVFENLEQAWKWYDESKWVQDLEATAPAKGFRIVGSVVIPAIICATALAIVCIRYGRKTGCDNGSERMSPREIWNVTKDAGPALLMPVIIVGGIWTGIFTPTEAAVVAAVYSLFVAIVIYRELKLNQIFDVMFNATKSTGVVMFLVAAAMVAAWMITIADLPGQVVELLQPLMGNHTLLMLAVVAVLFAIGAVMDLTPIILILTPVLLPVARQAGIDDVYFGVVFVVCGSIGLITPPIGTVLNVVAGSTKSNLWEVIKGVTPYLLSHSVVLLLLILFPELVLAPLRWITGR